MSLRVIVVIATVTAILTENQASVKCTRKTLLWWSAYRVANLTSNQTGCADACETLTPENKCYLQPGEIVQTAGIKGAKDTCNNFYSTRYPLYTAPTPAPSPQPEPTPAPSPAPVPVQPAKRGPNYCGVNWGNADATCDTTAQSCVGTRAEMPTRKKSPVRRRHK